MCCWRCSWLPLGRARGDGPHAEAVAIEIDAACVASKWHEHGEAYWLTVDALSVPDGRNQMVIGLAREIVEHDDGGNDNG